MMKFFAAGNTHEGNKRDHNEDDYLVDLQGVFVVADGMGGHRHGEIASRIVIRSFCESLATFDDPNITAPWVFDKKLSDDANMINGCIQWANKEIVNHPDNELDEDGRSHMGTTVVALRVGKEKVTYAHVGDSRIYLLRDGKLIRLTKDHSYHQDMIDMGIPEERVNKMPLKNIITRAVGLSMALKVDIGEITAMPGDKFLLCSDGLTNEVPDSDLELLLQLSIGPGQIVNMMIDKANSNGGGDNITAVVVCIL